MMAYGLGWYGVGGWLGMLGFMLLVAAAIIAFVWMMGRTAPDAGVGPTPAPRPSGEDAAEVLRVRFAKGEMTREEYLAAKKTLDETR